MVAFKETVMKTMLVAVVIALVPVNLTGELSFIHAESSKASIAAPAGCLPRVLTRRR